MTVGRDDPAAQLPSEEAVQRAIAKVRAQRPMPWRPRRFPVERWRRTLGVLLQLASGGFLYVNVVLGASRPLGSLIFVPSLLLFSGWSVWRSARKAGRREALRLVVPARGLICPECHFALPRSVPEGVCPECGTRYAQRDLIQMWRVAYELQDELPSEILPRKRSFMERLAAPLDASENQSGRADNV